MRPFGVSQINKYIGRLLQTDPILGNVSIIGEVSNLKYHSTGHVFFSLKESDSRISCFLPGSNRNNIRYELSDGMEIVASGYLSVFERGGTYSLTVKDIQVEGRGSLDAAFRALKEKLEKEGLFDPIHKKTLPGFPKKVAVITSPTGAALRDIIKIITGRNHYVDVLVYPCLVQGPGAAAEIADAIDSVNRLFPETDVMIVGRGGGSAEELWAFNEEIVARSIFQSSIPVISAVGHETDFSISDFAADVRAETPTAAAQMAVPHTGELLDYMTGIRKQLAERMEQMIRWKEIQMKQFDARHLRNQLESRTILEASKLKGFVTAMEGYLKAFLKTAEMELEKQYLLLEAADPKKILKRGYSIVLDQSGNNLSSIRQIQPGMQVDILLQDGRVTGEIQSVDTSSVDGNVMREGE